MVWIIRLLTIVYKSYTGELKDSYCINSYERYQAYNSIRQTCVSSIYVCDRNDEFSCMLVFFLFVS